MKTILCTLFATFALAFAASASPTLHLDTKITERHAKGGADVLTAPRITVESGKRATVQVGTLGYAVTPTLQKDGTVDLRVVITQERNGKADRLAAARLKAKLGAIAEIQVNDLTFTAKTTLAK